MIDLFKQMYWWLHSVLEAKREIWGISWRFLILIRHITRRVLYVHIMLWTTNSNGNVISKFLLKFCRLCIGANERPFDKTCTASSVNGKLDRFTTVYYVYLDATDCLPVVFLPLLVFLLLLGPLLVWTVTVKNCSDQLYYQKGNHHHIWSS